MAYTSYYIEPFIVKNHNNNKFEVLIQDSLNILYQVSNEGVILWGDSIQDAIVSEIATEADIIKVHSA